MARRALNGLAKSLCWLIGLPLAATGLAISVLALTLPYLTLDDPPRLTLEAGIVPAIGIPGFHWIIVANLVELGRLVRKRLDGGYGTSPALIALQLLLIVSGSIITAWAIIRLAGAVDGFFRHDWFYWSCWAGLAGLLFLTFWPFWRMYVRNRDWQRRKAQQTAPPQSAPPQ